MSMYTLCYAFVIHVNPFLKLFIQLFHSHFTFILVSLHVTFLIYRNKKLVRREK